jgi:hypothetical protein
MQKINIEVEAFQIHELFWTEFRKDTNKEMRRVFGSEWLKRMVEIVCNDAETHCNSILNTSIEVDIDVGNFPHFSFEVVVRILAVSNAALPTNSDDPKHNSCANIQSAAKSVEDIQLFSRVLNTLKSVDEHKPAQESMEDLIDIRTRELTYELVQSISRMFSEKIDLIHKDHWAEEQAVKSGSLFTGKGKLIEGFCDFEQKRSIWNT